MCYSRARLWLRATCLPDDESADYWLRFNLEGDEVAVYGGFDGLAVCVSDGGYNPLGGGPHYSMIEYSAHLVTSTATRTQRGNSYLHRSNGCLPLDIGAI